MTDFNRATAILSASLGKAFDDGRYAWVAKKELCFRALLVLDAEGFGVKGVLWLLDVLKDEHIKNGAKSWYGHEGCIQSAVFFGMADRKTTDVAFDYLIRHKAALNISKVFSHHLYIEAQLCRGGDGGFRAPQVVAELVKKPLYAREFCKSALHNDDLEAVQWLRSLKGADTHLTQEWLSTWISRLSEDGVKVDRVAEHYGAENHALPPTPTMTLDGYWQTLLVNFINVDTYSHEVDGKFMGYVPYTPAQRLGFLEQFFDAKLIQRAPVEFIEQVMKLGNAEFINANLLIMRMIKVGIDCYEGFLAGHYGRLGYLDRRDSPRDYQAMVAVCASKLSRPGYLPLLSTVPLEAVLAHPQKDKLLRALHEATGDPRYVHAMHVKERGKAFSKDLGI